MSAIRDPAYITNAGRTMITAGGDISYTKAILYGQDISHLEKAQIEALTTIGNPLLEVKVGISVKKNTDNRTTVVLQSTFQNSNLKSDLPYTAVGFFAKKGNDEEKLVLVAVANSGAYLSATRPDGVATDALDLKVAITIGDAANVTAVVDPSGSVTPATLSGAITKATQDLTALIDTKADKQTVDDEISKIDFTPYAKTADIDQKLEAYDKITDVDDKIKKVTDLANSKVDATYSYSKDELDKKLLALSTDTNGKIDAAQVADMINGKANTNDVYNKKEVDDAFNVRDQKIDTKADKSTTYTKLDIDKALKSIDFGKIGIKENYLNSNTNVAQRTIFPVKQSDGNWIFDRASDDVTAETASDALKKSNNNEGEINQLNTRFDKYAGSQAVKNADANDLTTSGTYFVDSPGNNFPIDHWGVLVVHQANEDGNIRLEQTFYPDDNSSPWFRTKITDTWKPWYQVASKEDINDLNSKIDSNDKATITMGYDWSEGRPINETRTLQNAWLVDQNVLKGAVDRMSDLQNQINDRATNSKVNVDAPLFRRITSSNTWQDILGVTNGSNVLESIRDDSNGGNTLGENSAAIAFGGGDTKGVLSVGYANHKARIMGGNVDRPQWHEDIAWKSDIQNLLNMINQQSQQIQLLTTQLNNAKNEIDYIKQNYVEGKRFASNQEDQAKAWESQNSQRVAFISD